MPRYYPIDEFAQHPSYADALRLIEVKEGVEFVIFDPDNDTIQVVVPATSYQTSSVTKRIQKSSVTLFTTDIHGNPVDLRGCGVHHYEDGTWSSSISILANYASVRRLYAELKPEHHPNAVHGLERIYVGYINGLDQRFWNNVRTHLAKQRQGY